MKKLCAKQNRRAKQWGKIENFANTSQCVRNLSEFRNGCEFGNVVCEVGKVVCEFGKVVCEVGKVVCEVGNGCQLIANRLPISQGCQLVAKIPALLFLF